MSKHSAQTFPSKGQEAIAIGTCLALQKGDDVLPSFRTRGAMIGMGISLEEQLREFLHTPLAAGDSRDAPHHASWPERGVMPGSTMIGGHLAMAAGVALANQCDRANNVRWLSSVMAHWSAPARDHAYRRRLESAADPGLREQWLGDGDALAQGAQAALLDPYANSSWRRVKDGNDALDVYHAARWARATALGGQPVFLDCLTFRMGLYSSHFGEVRAGIEDDLAEAAKRDPLTRLGEWLIGNGLATAAALEQLQREEEQRVGAAFNIVRGEG
jgi:TPP-dependent pyruvate/acetoin dehydrogenase alpha subunit